MRGHRRGEVWVQTQESGYEKNRKVRTRRVKKGKQWESGCLEDRGWEGKLRLERGSNLGPCESPGAKQLYVTFTCTVLSTQEKAVIRVKLLSRARVGCVSA